MAKFILGTAQFGQGYGISNSKYSSAIKDLIKLKKICKKEKINTCDLSEQYYNRKTYRLLVNSFKNKIYKLSKLSKDNYKKKINDILCYDKKPYCIMFHNPSIMKRGLFIDILNYLSKIKKDKRVSKIGMSIYNKSEFWLAINLFKKNLDILQVPINIIDQRFLHKKIINKIKMNNIEIHARSIFLQGLLIMDNRPNYFKKWNKFFNKWDLNSLYEKKKACVQFVKKNKVVKKIIIGVDNSQQLKELILINKKKYQKTNIKIANIKDNKLINPTFWKL